MRDERILMPFQRQEIAQQLLLGLQQRDKMVARRCHAVFGQTMHSNYCTERTAFDCSCRSLKTNVRCNILVYVVHSCQLSSLLSNQEGWCDKRNYKFTILNLNSNFRSNCLYY